MYHNLFILASIAFLYGIVSKKIETTMISGPIIFVLLGLILGPSVLNFIKIEASGDLLSQIAEITLALVLFTEASAANIKVLKKSVSIPSRLLLLGLPLTIILGIVFAIILFPDFLFIEAAILAIILAPTDAALGKAVVSNPKVPVKIRESLNVESGLNDGICVPFLIMCIAFVDFPNSSVRIGMFFVQGIGIGAAVGLIITYVGSFLLKRCYIKGGISKPWEKIIIIALVFSMYSLAAMLGGSGFIACFVGGILFGIIAKKEREQLVLAAEGIGDLMALVTWTLFGAFVVGSMFIEINFKAIIYALLSLTVIRMLPVIVALFNSGIEKKGKIFMGWFGPRGLASIVFVVMIMDKDLPNNHVIVLVTVWTILLSVLAHGLSANPYANWLGKHSKTN